MKTTLSLVVALAIFTARAQMPASPTVVRHELSEPGPFDGEIVERLRQFDSTKRTEITQPDGTRCYSCHATNESLIETGMIRHGDVVQRLKTSAVWRRDVFRVPAAKSPFALRLAHPAAQVLWVRYSDGRAFDSSRVDLTRVNDGTVGIRGKGVDSLEVFYQTVHECPSIKAQLTDLDGYVFSRGNRPARRVDTRSDSAPPFAP